MAADGVALYENERHRMVAVVTRIEIPVLGKKQGMHSNFRLV